MAKRKMEWFGVRTLFRLVASGRAKSPEPYFDPSATLVEDRVVLFQATGFDHSLRQAEHDARRYCKATNFSNVYGQRVRLKFLRATDAFLIGEGRPGAGCEVYSSTSIVPRSVSDSRLVIERLGERRRGDWHHRQKFVDAAIVAEALEKYPGKA